jgi:hypothetical protein
MALISATVMTTSMPFCFMSVAWDRKLVAVGATAYFATTWMPACCRSSSYFRDWFTPVATSW